MKESLKRRCLVLAFALSALSTATATQSAIMQKTNLLIDQTTQNEPIRFLADHEVSNKLYTPSFSAGVQSHHLAYQWHKSVGKQSRVSTHDSVGKGKQWLGKNLPSKSILAFRLSSYSY